MAHPDIHVLVIVIGAAAFLAAVYLLRRQSARRAGFEQVFQHSPDGVVLVDAKRRIQRVNPAFEALFGWGAREVVGRPVDDIVADSTRLLEAHKLTVKALDGTPQHVEGVRRRRDGRLIHVEITVAPIQAGDRTTGFYALYRDVSDRKQAEQTLRESEERFRTVIEQSADPVYVLAERQYLMVNAAWERLTGYTAAEATAPGFTPRRLLAPESETVVDERRRLRDLGQALESRFELILLTKTGERRFVEANTTAIKLGSQRAVLGAYRDMTERRQLEAERRRAEEQRRVLEAQLQQAQKLEAIGQLTGGIAHDLNNVLTTVSLNAAALEERPEVGRCPELADLREAAEDGCAIVRQMLAFAGRDSHHPTRVDLGELVGDAFAVLRRVLPETINIGLEIQPNLPTVQADPTAVEQILINLATNARDAMPAGGNLLIDTAVAPPPPDVAPSAQAPAYVRLSVTDTGTGMDEHVRAHLFEPFFTTKARGKGAGLGLPLVYGLMQQHQGYVRLREGTGPGTTFDLWFPAEAVAGVRSGAALSARVPAARPTGAARPASGAAVGAMGASAARGSTLVGSETVLLVEDQALLRRATRRMLEARGYRVLEAADGEDGMAVFHQSEREIQAVIADLVMPKLGGDGMLKALREEGRDVPFVLTSGYAPGDILGHGADQLGVPFIAKPWKESELLATLRAALERRTA